MHSLKYRLFIAPLALVFLLVPLLGVGATGTPSATADAAFGYRAGDLQERTHRKPTATAGDPAAATPPASPGPPARGNTTGGAGRHIGPPAAYPNPSLTPGDLLPGVTGQETCVSGYAKGVRNVTSDEKAAVYQRYGLPDVPGMHEIDHFIPLTLGGSNALANLWPEPYMLPDASTLGAHEKDRVELYLHEQVCSGKLTLAQAQDEIRTDWVAVYERIPATNTSGTHAQSSTHANRGGR